VIKIIHIITTLTVGGAEMMLYKLLSRMDRKSFSAEVIVLAERGPVGEMIQKLGITVRALGMRRAMPNPLGLAQLARWLKQARPHAIQTWMYHANLLGGLAAKLAGKIPVAWGIHHSNLDPQANKRATIWVAKACAHFSRTLANRIIYCSESAQRAHAEIGYAPKHAQVIFNGIDLDDFKPDPTARASLRRELGLAENALLIGLAGRFDPQKDHHNFMQAAAQLQQQNPAVHFVLCGEGITWENQKLVAWIEAGALRGHCHLLGRRGDMPRLMAALDIAASSSYGEGFPNVIGEAMACGVPCAVTDAGDSALMVGDTGKVAPRRNPLALANAWRELIDRGPEKRQQLGQAARQRVQDNFALDKIVRQYEAVYKNLAAEGKRDARI